MSLVVTLGLLGLVVDIGWAYWRREAAQTAANSAAMAAALAANTVFNGGSASCTATGVVCQSDTACPASPSLSAGSNISNGCLYAQQNGFVNSGRQTVRLASNTSNSPVAGVSPDYWVSATVSETIPQTFSAVLGQTMSTVKTVSTVGVFIAPTSGCIYVMDQHAAASLKINGSSSAYITSGCGIYVNSDSGSALTLTGSASITTTGGAKTQVVGGDSINSNASVTPAPLLNQNPITDPFTAMVTPTIGTCGSLPNLNGHDSKSMNPGTYCDTMSVGGGQTLTLNAGTYVFNGGGISVSGGGSIVSNGGVTIYLTNSAALSITGGGTVSLTPPASGTYQGVLLWQDKSDNNTAYLTGGAAQAINGLLYFPQALLHYAGGTATGGGTSTTIVTNQLSVDGASYIANPATTQIKFTTLNGAYFLN